MIRRWVARVLATLVLLVVVAVGAGQLGLLQGQPPDDLGVTEGRLRAPSTTPNSVSSQARLWTGHPRAEDAYIEPLALQQGDGPATLATLSRLVQATPRAVLVSTQPDYRYAQFTTPLMRYTDDLEFWWDSAQGVVQVRSASRLGYGDQGLNRQRVEDLRQRLATTPPAAP